MCPPCFHAQAGVTGAWASLRFGAYGATAEAAAHPCHDRIRILTPMGEGATMHIADGALAQTLMLSTNILAAGAVGVGLWRTDPERIPRAGVLSAVFFVASSATFIPFGLGSVHLLLNGLLGLLLGWTVFPALAAALLLQAVLLGQGGVTVLGANLLTAGVPGLLCHILFARACWRAGTKRRAFVYGACAGAAGVVLTCMTLAFLLWLSDADAYFTLIRMILVMHVPVAGIEALVVGAAVAFFHTVRPEMLAPTEAMAWRAGIPDATVGAERGESECGG